ncbi:hypothetical protein [Luteibacter sp.]|uniref:hypothetical protein n=1 Tax=Luteibacter sp. TaxID=1886636 RepID=UPI003F82206E
MHTVKLTVLIDDPGDIDMEVRLVAPDTATATTGAAVTPLKPRVVASTTGTRDAIADDYALGGYAGI